MLVSRKKADVLAFLPPPRLNADARSLDINKKSRINLFFEMNRCRTLNLSRFYTTLNHFDLSILTENYKISDGKKIVGYIINGKFQNITVVY